jgi:hypothetical protein
MRILKWLGASIVAVVLLVAGVFVSARFHDGPLGLVPGGALVAGEVVAAPVDDWGFADVDTIEMQLAADSSSRTTWILVNEGRAFIPASLSFPPGKSWHKHADQDGAAWIRVKGQRYPVTLTRVQDETQRALLIEVVRAKYGGGPPGDGGVWFFEVVSRVGAS